MEDRELVRRARAGDRRAFGDLMERHQARVYATLVKMTGDRELALDLTQDAFLRAWERLDGFEMRAAFSTWLYRIAVRLAYDAMDRRRRRVNLEVDGRIADERTPSPEERVAAESTAEELRRRIAELPPMQRAVVVLRAWDELTYREIAEILDTTENSARVSFHYAIRRLREGLKETTRT